MKTEIEQSIREILKKLYPDHKDIVFTVEYAPDNIDADFASNVAMVLAKKVGKKPMEIAEELKNVILEGARATDRISDNKDSIASLQNDTSASLQNDTSASLQNGTSIDVIEPGFLNFKLEPWALTEVLKEIVQQGDLYGELIEKANEAVLVEYFQPNIAKPLHVGHMRSAVIGDSIYRIKKLFYKKVESDTHMGDWGTQFGILLLAYKTMDGENKVKKSPVEELNQLYVEMNSQIEKNEDLLEQAKQEFVKLEKKDQENRELWKKFVKWSMDEFSQTNELLDFKTADNNWPESFYEDKMPAVVDLLKAKNLLVESKGAQVVDLEAYQLGTAIIVKSDGGTTYLLRDLATFLFRGKEKRFGSQLYVVDVRQSHHFKQMFRILELLGEKVEKSAHLEFGFMKLPDGALSTRKGNVINLQDFVNEAEKRALQVIDQKNPNLSDKEKTARAVALGAIKYADLKNNRKSDIVFDWDEAFNFEGNSGPYIQYTHARLKSILRKKKTELDWKVDIGRLDQAELAVWRKLALYKDVVSDANRENMPNIVAKYMFDLASLVNTMYHSVKILEGEEDLVPFRLSLVAVTAQILKNSLQLLGIEAPEEM